MSAWTAAGVAALLCFSVQPQAAESIASDTQCQLDTSKQRSLDLIHLRRFGRERSFEQFVQDGGRE